MKLLLALLTFVALHFVDIHSAFAREAKGAEKRKVRTFQRLPMDIEDMIRAEDDPHFNEYIEKRKSAEIRDEKAADEQRLNREKWESDQETARTAYIEWRDKQVPAEHTESYQRHLQEQADWEQRHEQGRSAFVERRDEYNQKALIAKEERLKALSLDKRMPASLEEPKYPSQKKK